MRKPSIEEAANTHRAGTYPHSITAARVNRDAMAINPALPDGKRTPMYINTSDSAVIMAHIVIVLVLFFILYLPQHILKHMRAVHTSHMSQPWP